MAVNVVLKSVFDDKGVREAERAFDTFGRGIDKAFNAVAAAAGVAAIGIGKFGLDSINAASDLEESINAVNVSYLDAADAVLAIGANSAESLGLARTEFNAAAVRFSAFADRVVGEGGDIAGFIGDITTRAADFASVFNIDVAEALQVFQSGLAGEAEPLKRFGINLLESEVKAYALRAGLIEVGETMTEQEKVQARYGLLMESTAKTAGDFANTSDGLANSQRILRARFTDLQAEIGNALLPVVTDLFQAFAAKLLPKLEEIGDFLASPEGQQIIEDTAESFMNFFDAVVNNIDKIIDLTIKVAAAVVGLKILKTTIELSTIAMNLFNSALLRNPFVLLATGIVAASVAMTDFHYAQKRAREEATGLTGRTAEINAEFVRLRELVDANTITFEEYQREIKPLIAELFTLEGQLGATAGEINRFNNLRVAPKIDLSSWQREVNRVDTSSLAGIAEASGFGSIEELLNSGKGGGGGGGGGGGPTAFEQVQRFIKDSQKDLLEAQKDLNEGLERARENYAAGVLKTEKQFAERFAAIVQRSQDRLRSAFANVVRVSLADIFTVEETQSVENLVKGLQERLGKSRALLERAGELNAAGFSQTFIEQVVQAGVDTGNELAQAILDATPETQRELQGLFSEVEDTAETGMDSLAREIYDQAGLATRELRTLYENTQQELTDTLLQLKQDLDNDIIDANAAFVDSIGEIRDRLRENIAGMKGDLGGLEGTLEQFYGKLDKLEGGAKEDIASVGETTESAGQVAESTSDLITVAASAIQGATGILIDSASDVGAVYSYLGERIAAAERFASNIGDPAQAQSALAIAQDFRTQQAMLRGGVTTGTVININVKTDSTQSVAMVGKTLGNTINKYVTAGGQVLVSPT